MMMDPVNGQQQPIINTGSTTLPAPIGSPPSQLSSSSSDHLPLNGSDLYSNGAGAPGPSSVLQAIGAERHNHGQTSSSAAAAHQQQQKVDNLMDYSTNFPKLPDVAPITSPISGKQSSNAWVKPIHSNIVTQVFHLAADERQSRSREPQFGNVSEEQKKCNVIAASTETTIELCEAKDHSLTIVISGKRAKVEDARTRIIRELQHQASREIAIPKEHHRVLIGKEGANLRQLEAETDCRIYVPGRDNASDLIRVTGPREGIEKALHQIQLVSDEQSKLAQEHLTIPKMYYPWIRGPFNETLDQLVAETGAKINMPPPSAKSEIIVITGERDGVHRAAAEIRRIFEQQQALVKPVTCQVSRVQHRYVIGQQRRGLSEILKATGVSVEVPNEGSDSDTITLRGDASRLSEALAMVFAKAASVITAHLACPTWLHKFLIGPKGQTLQSLVPNKKGVQVDFEDNGIFLEGSPEEVKAAQAVLQTEIVRLEKEMATETFSVHPSLHRHVIGRGGSLISKIKEETGVQITIPNEQTNSDEIRVEGKKEGVAKAIADIKEIVKRIENEKSRDILIEQRFHKQIIGQKGDAINELRKQYPTVVFTFPETGRKSDVVTLRGDKEQVDRCFKQMTAIVKELHESNYQMVVPIFKDFHKHIIGKGGSNVKKIRDETQTQIDLPSGESGEDKITVTGKKANVEKAVEQLTKIQNELASVVMVEVKIPVKIHSRMLGGGQRLIHDIQDECGGVQIRFPPEKSNSEKVTIRGPKDDVARAEKLLMDLAKDREHSTHEDSISCKAEFHRFLIGKGGMRIKKIRESYSDVRILFPRDIDKDKETIHLIGKKEEVAAVKKTLEGFIKELNETVESSMDVDPKWHKHFVIRGAAVLREIQEQNGNVTISFSRAGSNDSKVMLKGSKQCIESAKQRIEEIVHDLASQISVQVSIPSRDHRALLSNRGQKIQDIVSKYNVQVKFPERHLREEAERNAAENGNATDGVHSPSPLDQITVSGAQDNVEKAKEALLALVPITKAIAVSADHHSALIGKGGEWVRQLMQTHDVNVNIPGRGHQSDEITVTGAPEMVENAVTDILNRVGKLDEEADDRRLRSFKVTLDVPNQYHQRLIGRKGAVVDDLRERHDVDISFPWSERDDNRRPPKGPQKEKVAPDTIVITGYQENAEACRKEIEDMIGEMQAQTQFTQEISVDARIHPRLIGQKGRNIKKIMDQYGVLIRFPRNEDTDPNLVTVAGKSEDSVYDCIDHLRNLEEEYNEESKERGQYQYPRQVESAPIAPSPSLQITGAPWQLNMESVEEFPEIGGPGAVAGRTTSSSGSGPWGGARRF